LIYCNTNVSVDCFSRSTGRIDAVSDLQDKLESLLHENARLRQLLKLTDAEASPTRGTQAADAWTNSCRGRNDASR